MKNSTTIPIPIAADREPDPPEDQPDLGVLRTAEAPA
jgi:hypothetical protein